MNEDINRKVENYERVVNEKFKRDLENVLKEQEQIYSDIVEYLQIKEAIEKIQAGKSSDDHVLKTKVDLGCNFYANAVIEDTSMIYVAIGYGFFLQMKLDEALRFIEKKVKSLNESALELNKLASEIKAKIRFVLEGLRELQQIDFVGKPEEKHSLFI